MRDQEIIGLWEAYQQVHSQPQEEVEQLDEEAPERIKKSSDRNKSRKMLSGYPARLHNPKPRKVDEEVEVAAQYFYDLGLNEEGVAIIIEELGVEEFGDFVYELSEEYYLDEATETRLQSKGALKGPKGSKPQSVTKGRVKAQGGTKMSVSDSPSSTIKKDRPKKVAAAVEKAKETQSKKRPVLDAIARQVTAGMERHKAAMGAARETGKTVGKAAKGASTVAKGFASGIGAAAKMGKKILTGEEVDLFDYVLEYLVSEGYADTNENALVIMTNMSEEWRESIIEETKRTEYLQKKFDKENKRKSGAALSHIPGKQNTGQALRKARESEKQMRGEN